MGCFSSIKSILDINLLGVYHGLDTTWNFNGRENGTKNSYFASLLTALDARLLRF